MQLYSNKDRIETRRKYLTEQRLYNPSKSLAIQEILDFKDEFDKNAFDYLRKLSPIELILFKQEHDNINSYWNLPITDQETYRNMLVNALAKDNRLGHNLYKFNLNSTQLKLLQYHCLNKQDLKIWLISIWNLHPDIKFLIYKEYIWLICPNLYLLNKF